MGGFINDAIHKVRLNRSLANNTSQRHFNKRGYTNKNAYNLESQKSPKLSIEELKILEEKCKRDLAKRKAIEEGTPIILSIIFIIAMLIMFWILF